MHLPAEIPNFLDEIALELNFLNASYGQKNFLADRGGLQNKRQRNALYEVKPGRLQNNKRHYSNASKATIRPYFVDKLI